MGMTYSINGVELPVGLQVFEAERVDVLVDGESDLDEEVHKHETLGTNLEGQDFDGISDKKTRPGKRVRHGEHPDKSDDGATGGSALLGFLLRGADRPENEDDAHAGSSGDEEGPATDAVDQHGARDGDNERENGQAAVHTELSVAISNADRLVHIGGIVRDETVAGPLREETKRSNEQKSVAVAAGLEEVEVAAGLLVLEFETDGLLDLVVLELDGRVVDVAVGVVLSKNVESLFVAFLGDQPTGGLRNEEDESKLNDGREGLGEGGDSPGPVGLDSLGAESEPCADDGTDVPQTVVDGSDPGTMLRMAQFGQKKRGGELSERVSETHEETTGHEHVQVLGSSLDGGTDNHDQASNGDGGLTTEMIGNVGTAR
jgi:hypothetical protein